MTIDLPICLEDVQKILEVIIVNEHLKNPKLTFEDGSKMGDGFLAVNTAVTITDETDDFAPKFYAGSTEDMKELIVLENLKKAGFELNGVRKTFSKEQLVLILEKYGQFHGSAFALKDQNEATFNDISTNIPDVLHLMFTSMGLSDIVRFRCKFIEDYLQSPEDAIILEKIRVFAENLDGILLKIQEHKSEFKTILHGDCWCNNMMFRQNKEIRLIDFQCIRINSPTESPPDVVEFAESQPPDFIKTLTDKNKQDFVDRIRIIVKHLDQNDFI
ncbi:Ecdysteroid kinase-like family [Popillia japonica]|uniref:Ecdysteroid kinase-like family n=1 Tax=Popillia japonica TaxID=7064 RepID=A0AAW1K348_POPJA